ncbi:unnamed protein product [Nippostrongylus brasiliensis]|uniref:Low-density lipoprotein receptor domain class A n=1 Tax=Nippostrongylus brasiliensis TaxID=27835 RepID=A0A0N4XWN4_NIPBR|nr:unnamed protein product [Nippostrongylus brasiliensis]
MRWILVATLVVVIDFSTAVEDEAERTLARCPSLQYIRCADGILCIHKRWMCDGRIDCPDHSDEDESVCSKRPRPRLDGSARFVPRTGKCPRTWFFCVDGSKCVASRYICDGTNDCR